MKQIQSSLSVTRWVNRIIFLMVTALLFFLPSLLRWYESIRLLLAGQQQAILISYYTSAAFILYALWCIDRLLGNISQAQVFTHPNVTLIAQISFCCAGVGLVCLIGGCFYPPLLFLFIIMGFLSMVIHVVGHVIRAAVVLQEENALTI